jgi:hypothetical protein
MMQHAAVPPATSTRTIQGKVRKPERADRDATAGGTRLEPNGQRLCQPPATSLFDGCVSALVGWRNDRLFALAVTIRFVRFSTARPFG